MTPYSANPFIYIFSIALISAVILYFVYAAVNTFGLSVTSATGIVTGKQYNPPGESYYTTIAAGRTWVQSQVTPETYAVLLTVNGEPTVGLVTKDLYDQLKNGDTVNVKIRRTRISKRLDAMGITK